MHAYDLQHTTKYPANEVSRSIIDPKFMRPFLEAVIALEKQSDQALIEDLKTLHVFKNARWMLEHQHEHQPVLDAALKEQIADE